MIHVNSKEYQCWHEIGHAFTCIHYGGDVEFVEFINDSESRGLARARCHTNEDIRHLVACGGFAAEFFLLRAGRLGSVDERWITQELFKNATIDRESFFRKPSGSDFSKEEDTQFMNVAVYTVKPELEQYESKFQVAVGELLANDRIEGNRLKEIMGIKTVEHPSTNQPKVGFMKSFIDFLKNFGK
ncbi:hypothetical protein HJ027_22850 [Vibrio parahaemolyticus]|nr:hypothetical protein [Vibrio parahaemolyticus]